MASGSDGWARVACEVCCSASGWHSGRPACSVQVVHVQGGTLHTWALRAVQAGCPASNAINSSELFSVQAAHWRAPTAHPTPTCTPPHHTDPHINPPPAPTGWLIAQESSPSVPSQLYAAYVTPKDLADPTAWCWSRLPLPPATEACPPEVAEHIQAGRFFVDVGLSGGGFRRLCLRVKGSRAHRVGGLHGCAAAF